MYSDSAIADPVTVAVDAAPYAQQASATGRDLAVSVFGIGYVGAVSAACLVEDNHRVVAVDVNADKVARLNAGQSPVVEPGLAELIGAGIRRGRLHATGSVDEAVTTTDISFVCVGTPSRHNGALDLSFVERVCAEIGTALAKKSRFHTVVIRSTVLPGSTEQILIPALEQASGKRAGQDFGVAMCPEFLREGTAVRDYREGATVVIGVQDARTEASLRDLFAALPGHLIATDITTAELVKYASNAWHATKVVFANELGSISKSLGIDGPRVMDILCADTRLNTSRAYMRPGFAFGGSCLPKDVRALAHRARTLDVDCPLIDSLLPSNRHHLQRVVDLVRDAANRRVGIVGLSFKGATDDLRESPAVALAEHLIGTGYDLKIFDRNVCVARLTGANRAFIEQRLPHMDPILSEDLDDVVRHAETLILCHADLGEGRRLPAVRPGQTVIDLVRMGEQLDCRDGTYVGICW